MKCQKNQKTKTKLRNYWSQHFVLPVQKLKFRKVKWPVQGQRADWLANWDKVRVIGPPSSSVTLHGRGRGRKRREGNLLTSGAKGRSWAPLPCCFKFIFGFYNHFTSHTLFTFHVTLPALTTIFQKLTSLQRGVNGKVYFFSGCQTIQVAATNHCGGNFLISANFD